LTSLDWPKLLKDLRKEAGLSQRELADMTGLPQRTLAEYESMINNRHLSIYRVEKILDCLGYDLDACLRDK
jgi:transcriptional regulator with XRE-family HTH domain